MRAARDTALPTGDVFVSVVGEAGQSRDIRSYLPGERGMDPSRLQVTGHWRVGTAGYDHHEPIEV